MDNPAPRAQLSLQLSPSAVTLLRLLEEGALAPLRGYMGAADYQSVMRYQRLSDGSPYPLPLVLPVDSAERFPLGSVVALRDAGNRLLGQLTVREVFSLGPQHDGRTMPRRRATDLCAIRGSLHDVHIPQAPAIHEALTQSMQQVRAAVAQRAPNHVLAIETDGDTEADTWNHLRELVHEHDAFGLWQLFPPEARLDDYERFSRMQRLAKDAEDCSPHGFCICETVLEPGTDPRVLLLRMLIHHNYGADMVLLPRSLLTKHSLVTDTDVEAFIRYCRETYFLQVLLMETSGSAMARCTMESRGCCIWLTGLSGAGKSSIAEQLVLQLMRAGRRATLLDGDVVRTHLSKGLTFSPKDRHTNICRVGYVASEIVRHEGIAVCALVSPYRQSREEVRRMMPGGRFVEVFVDTRLDVCESRDTKGLYAEARDGRLPLFTGITDVYEAPVDPEIHLHGLEAGPEGHAATILQYLAEKGILRPAS